LLEPCLTMPSSGWSNGWDSWTELCKRPDVVLFDVGGFRAAPGWTTLPHPTCPPYGWSLLRKVHEEPCSSGQCGVLHRETEPPPTLDGDPRAAASGLLVLEPSLLSSIAPETSLDRPLSSGTTGTDLTAREREVLELLARGLSNKSIGQALGISDHTAKFHVNSLLSKLGAQSRTEVVVRAAKRGWLSL